MGTVAAICAEHGVIIPDALAREINGGKCPMVAKMHWDHDKAFIKNVDFLGPPANVLISIIFVELEKEKQLHDQHLRLTLLEAERNKLSFGGE